MKTAHTVSGLDTVQQHRITFSEWLLLLLSRDPGSSDYQVGIESWESKDALAGLRRSFPCFMTSVVGKNVLDFGCGLGYQVTAMAAQGAAYVLGVESNKTRLERARNLWRDLTLGGKVEFTDRLPAHLRTKFDLVISQNSMEHYPDPAATLSEMRSALKPGGKMLIVFCPPWFAPYGSHMHFFTKVPWVNILFDERTVMNVRARFRSDGATHYEEVESGLNRMTVAKFERIIAESGLKIENYKYECVKGLNLLGKIPVLRELFINRIGCTIMEP